MSRWSGRRADPGGPEGGISYDEAVERCRYLSEDGTTLMDEPQDIWRLPTVEEAVLSMALHGENAGGVWNMDTQSAQYEVTPDKEDAALGYAFTGHLLLDADAKRGG